MRTTGLPLFSVYCVGLFLWLFIGANSAYADKHALLIGIGDYVAENARDLEGPKYDVHAVQSLLVKRWAFPAENIKTLVDREATRANVLDGLNKLKDQSHGGDMVFVYISGHGTSRYDNDASLPLAHGTGAIIPADMPVQGSLEEKIDKLLIGRRDFRPVLEYLDQNGRQVFVAIDSCFSGNTVRSLFGTDKLPTRYQPLSGGGPNKAGSMYAGNRPKPPPYPYKNVVYLSAASDSEKAVDIDRENLNTYPTVDGNPHGTFTDAMLRVLGGEVTGDLNNDGRITYGELHQSIVNFIVSRKYNPSHTPQILPGIKEDTTSLSARSVFETSQTFTLPEPEKPLALRVQLTSGAEELENSLLGLKIKVVKDRPDLIVKKTASGLLLISGSGDRIAEMKTKESKSVVARLEKEAVYHRLRTAPIRGKKFNLRLGQLDSAFGEVAYEGERIAFIVQNDEPTYLLLMDMQSDGSAVVLYPYLEKETTVLPTGTLTIPGADEKDKICVQPPFGMDRLLAFGFAEKPSWFDELSNQHRIDLIQLESMINDSAIRMGRTALDLMTVEKSNANACQ